MNYQKKKKKSSLLIAGLVIASLIVVGGAIFFFTKNSSQKSTSSNENQSELEGKLSQTELEKYLLEKRLDLQKYFVFNLGELGEEVEFGGDGDKKFATREIKKTGSLARDLSNLTGFAKGFVKLDKPNDPEWNGEKLDQKIKQGKIYIVFEKKLPENGESWFGGVPLTNKNTNETVLVICAFDLLSPKVSIFPTKKEALDFLRKNDPVFSK